MAEMFDMLALSAHLPEVAFAPGDLVVEEGGSAGSLWVLVSGALQVTKGPVLINTVTRPGALVGEIAVLRGHEISLSIAALVPIPTISGCSPGLSKPL